MPIDPEASENWEAFAQGLRAGMEGNLRFAGQHAFR